MQLKFNRSIQSKRFKELFKISLLSNIVILFLKIWS